MNLLTDTLPDEVVVGNQKYRIHADFRTGIRFSLMENPGVRDLLLLYYRDRYPRNIEEAVQAVLDFYLYDTGYKNKEDGRRNLPQKYGREYCFEQDAGAIYSSFWQAYRIDLTKEDLHWWAFKALFFGLPPDTMFKKIIHFRTADISKMGKEEKKYYSEMKKLYALREGKHIFTLEQRNDYMRSYVLNKHAEVQYGKAQNH